MECGCKQASNSFYIILVLFFLALSGCNPTDPNKVDITLKDPNSNQIPFNITVSNIQVINHQIIITGTNLTNVTMFDNVISTDGRDAILRCFKT